MRLHHATPARNLAGILARGLLTRRSRGKRKVVWLAPVSLSSWCVLHVSARHKVRVGQVIVLEVKIPRSWLKRHGRRLWYCDRDIPPSRIISATTFAAVAATGD